MYEWQRQHVNIYLCVTEIVDFHHRAVISYFFNIPSQGSIKKTCRSLKCILHSSYMMAFHDSVDGNSELLNKYRVLVSAGEYNFFFTMLPQKKNLRKNIGPLKIFQVCKQTLQLNWLMLQKNKFKKIKNTYPVIRTNNPFNCKFLSKSQHWVKRVPAGRMSPSTGSRLYTHI